MSTDSDEVAYEFERPLHERLGGIGPTALAWNTRAAEAYFTRFTGRWYDVLADRDRPNRITAQDLTAVSMLGVTIPAGFAAWVLGPGAEDISRLLRQVPVDRRIHDPWDGADPLDDDGPASRLWSLLQQGSWPEASSANDVGWVKAGKLLAAKRPALLPVYDAEVRRYLGDPPHFWKTLRAALSTPEDRLLVSLPLAGVSSAAPADVDLTFLRAIDIVLWMRATGWKQADRSLGPPPAASDVE